MSATHRPRSGLARVEENVRAIREMELASIREAGWTGRAGEAVADFAGTMRFVVLHIVWFTVWIAINVRIVPGIAPFDPYPFTFLTFCVSLEAILLTSIVLISQKRLGRLADERAQLDLQINLLAEQESTETLRLLQALCEKAGVSVADTADGDELAEPTRPSAVADVVRKNLERPRSGPGA